VQHPTTSKRLAAALLLALALGPEVALAQEGPLPAEPAPAAAPTPEAARAEALFQEGKSLLDAGRTAEACDKLAQSDKLDPGIGSLGLLAACHEAEGRIATAWREYQETATRAEAANDERAAFARERAAALEPTLPRLTVRLGRRSAATEVFRNKERLAPDALGVAVPVDPGAYEIVARGPHMPEQRVTITVKPGAQAVVDLPDFKPAPNPPSNPPVALPVKEAPSGLGPRRTAGLVIGGVGLVGVVVGAVAGAQALGQNRESVAIHDNCITRAACEQGRALREGAFRNATLSTVGFTVGGAALVAGAVMFAIPVPKTERRTAVLPFASGNGGGAVVLGQF
jgi:tetratricopeptide (TPR) repeat protein